MTYEKIVTLYDTAEHAEAAKRSLEGAGFSPGEISMINSKTLSLAGDKLREPGLWHRLFNRDIEQHEATAYARSVENGGVVLTIRVAEEDAGRATSILNAHLPVDTLKRADQERTIATGTQTKTATAPMRPAVASAAAVSGEEVLALAEEQINVGKRVIKEGTTRIRRFVTESPVETQVTLHEEHTRVLRRASTDPAFLRNLDWSDKTIEVTETIEEPVVTKSVHIAEEVVIQREGSDHVKTLKDKVRRQQIEVERISNTEPVGKV